MEAVAEPENGFTRDKTAARLQERLTKRHQTRQEDAERRREARESHAVAEERSEYFTAAFNQERAAAEQLLSAGPGEERAAAAQRLEEATAKTAHLQKFLSDSVPFLTQYELRRAQAALQKLQTALNEAREEALPKKRFAFRARSKAKESASAPPPIYGHKTDAGSAKVDGKLETEQCTFSDLSDVCVTKTAEEIQQRDVLLTHLRRCRVRLLGSPSTLHLKHIESCEILCGPVSSSVFIDHCRNSTLAFPCQQLRTHNTTDTAVYLHVTSRAIIEDCTGVGFAPFSWHYPTLDQDFKVSGLDRGRNNWSDVDDFNWLAAGTPSPNWSVIPEEERRVDWDA